MYRIAVSRPVETYVSKNMDDIGRDATDAECFNIPVFDVNSKMGPEIFSLILLEFGGNPRAFRTNPSGTQAER